MEKKTITAAEAAAHLRAILENSCLLSELEDSFGRGNLVKDVLSGCLEKLEGLNPAAAFVSLDVDEDEEPWPLDDPRWEE